MKDQDESDQVNFAKYLPQSQTPNNEEQDDGSYRANEDEVLYQQQKLGQSVEVY